jgi:hypothetical protein
MKIDGWDKPYLKAAEATPLQILVQHGKNKQTIYKRSKLETKKLIPIIYTRKIAIFVLLMFQIMNSGKGGFH